MKHVKLTFDDWWEQFKPVKNHIVTSPDSRPCDNHMFETYGDEDLHVRNVAEDTPLKVWTVLDCDGEWVIGDGWHWVNRVGYFITENPADPDTNYEIDY